MRTSASRIAWVVLLVLAALWTLNHLAGTFLFAGDTPRLVFVALAAVDLAAVLVLLFPYRRRRWWAWLFVWAEVATIASVFFWADRALTLGEFRGTAASKVGAQFLEFGRMMGRSMDSKSTSDLEAAEIQWLTTNDYSWLRVDIPMLAEFDPRGVLTGSAVLPALRAVVHEHGAVGDLVGTYWASLFLISSRFARVLREQEMTGWSALPVKSDETTLAGMSLLQVTGRCGAIKTGSDAGGVGRLLDPATLDGSDVFTPENEASVLVSPRCSTALRRANLRNVGLEPAGIEFSSVTGR